MDSSARGTSVCNLLLFHIFTTLFHCYPEVDLLYIFSCFHRVCWPDRRAKLFLSIISIIKSLIYFRVRGLVQTTHRLVSLSLSLFLY